jgi:hypothetical protein
MDKKILSSDLKTEIIDNSQWDSNSEKILKKWADKALCFKLMHERANKKYWCLNAWFNIPVIIISTITGTGNFASSAFGDYSTYAAYVIGAFNISAGILATISTYLGVAQKLEAHRFASLSWDKFSRKLQMELAKSREDRIREKEFIKQCSEEYDRLVEISPILPNDVIRWFINIVKTGEFEDKANELVRFIYEIFCFPWGCGLCSCFKCMWCDRKSSDEIDRIKKNKDSWKYVELPEVLGRIRPTEIAPEPEPELPPPLIISEKKELLPKKERENEYDIYNLSAIGDDTV